MSIPMDPSDGAPARNPIQGAEQLTRRPTAAEQRWGITRPELERRHKASPDPNGDIERRCPDCGRRVTQTSKGFEAGHTRGRKAEECPQYPKGNKRPHS